MYENCWVLPAQTVSCNEIKTPKDTLVWCADTESPSQIARGGSPSVLQWGGSFVGVTALTGLPFFKHSTRNKTKKIPLMCVKWILICSVQKQVVREEGLMFLHPWFFHQLQGDLLACYSHLGPLWYWLLAMLPLCIDQSVVDEQKSKATLLALSFEMEQPISVSVLGQLPGESRRNIFLFYLIFKCYFIWIYMKLLIRSIFPLCFFLQRLIWDFSQHRIFSYSKNIYIKIKTVKGIDLLFDGLDLSVIYRGWACCLNLTKCLHTDKDFSQWGEVHFTMVIDM